MLQLLLLFLLIITITLALFSYSRSHSLQIKSASTPTVTELAAAYSIPSFWQNNGDPSGKGCTSYSFLPTAATVPPRPNLADIYECLSSNSCITDDTVTCLDDDTIFVEQRNRTCRYGELVATSIAEYAGCQLINGNSVKINGYSEDYLATCSPQSDAAAAKTTVNASNRCPGSVALLMVNLVDIPTTSCFAAPSYSLDSNSRPILFPDAALRVQPCNLASIESNTAIQLFRVIRSVLSGTTFTNSNIGNWCQLIHRASRKLVAPYALDSNNVWNLASLDYTRAPILTSSSAVNTTGYWWYLTPSYSGLADADYYATYLYNIARISLTELTYFRENGFATLPVTSFPQLVFVANSTTTPNYLKDVTKALQYFTAHTKLSTNSYVSKSWSLAITEASPRLHPFCVYAGNLGNIRPSTTGLDFNSSSVRKVYGAAVVQYELYRLALETRFQYVDMRLVPIINSNSANSGLF